MSKNKIKKIIQNYVRALSDDGFVFSEVYLFGSHATGKATVESDLDLAIITQKKNIHWSDRATLWRLAGKVNSLVEPLLLTQNDFKNGSTTMAFEVRKHGKRVFKH